MRDFFGYFLQCFGIIGIGIGVVPYCCVELMNEIFRMYVTLMGFHTCGLCHIVGIGIGALPYWSLIKGLLSEGPVIVAHMPYVSVCCSVLQCVAVCCSVL